MRRLPPLNALRAFEAAGRHLSFAKAADELAITPSALSHQIRHLEEQLNLTLFERRARKVNLTEAGERLLPFLSEGFDLLGEGVQRALAVKPERILVVSTGPALSAKWLSPRLYQFVEAHPDIELRIAANLALVDFKTDDADVAIRFGHGNYEGLYVEKLFDDYVLPLASPQFVKDRDLSDPANLKNITLLHDTSLAHFPDAPTWETWLKAAKIDHPDPKKGPRFTHADHGIDAAMEGAGIVLGRLSLSARDIKTGRLVVPYDLKQPTGYTFWFCCPPQNLEKERVRLFRDWIVSEARADQATWPL